MTSRLLYLKILRDAYHMAVLLKNLIRQSMKVLTSGNRVSTLRIDLNVRRVLTFRAVLVVKVRARTFSGTRPKLATR
jgi:hypothetical protein